MCLRLKLLDSVVTPAVLYSLSTTPLTASQRERLDCTQRKMLRKIVGTRRRGDEDGAETGRRTRQCLEAALARYPMQSWSARTADRQQTLLSSLNFGSLATVACQAFGWKPQSPDSAVLNGVTGHRMRGRPRVRWHDAM